jgi:hypothetical protein
MHTALWSSIDSLHIRGQQIAWVTVDFICRPFKVRKKIRRIRNEVRVKEISKPKDASPTCPSGSLACPVQILYM